MICDAGAKLDMFADSAGYTPIMLAVKLGMIEVANYLSLRGLDLNQMDPENKTLITHFVLDTQDLIKNAQQGTNLSLIKLLDFARRLIARGADINFTHEELSFGQTYLI